MPMAFSSMVLPTSGTVTLRSTSTVTVVASPAASAAGAMVEVARTLTGALLSDVFVAIVDPRVRVG